MCVYEDIGGLESAVCVCVCVGGCVGGGGGGEQYMYSTCL